MARIRSQLPKAPITEAVIDIQIPSAGAKLADVQKFANSVEGYQNVAPIFQIETIWAVKQAAGPEHRSGSSEVGTRLQTEDGKFVIQARTQGLAVSRLAPYENWESLITEARRQWIQYAALVKPPNVARIATRFINKLKLPMKPGEHFEEYLVKPPAIPDELPQGVLGFTQQMVMLKPDNGARANVTMILVEGPAPADHVPVVLDIDVYHSAACDPESEDVWKLLEQLRAFKNVIFFASITEKTARLFECQLLPLTTFVVLHCRRPVFRCLMSHDGPPLLWAACQRVH